ncbi:MAG TPA: agmatine deiminase family protein [Solirubrobacteraceae bacterium]|nr:agmatine deiminase family protein [Solirubrobacteraceae bacterium]
MRAPAEWEPHERTLMGWPCRAELWGETIGRARADYARVANAIAAFEPVTMIANPGRDAADARAACTAGVEVVELELDDSWLRDCGPIYVRDDAGRRTAVHFRFNAWGGRFPPWDRDAAVGALIARRLGDPVLDGGIVLEGGSILSDGAGTLLTTEQCLLCPNRNPSLDRDQIEAVLRERLGVERIVWLAHGLVEDRDTDGHVDMVCSLSAPGRALLQAVPEDNPNFERCQENRERLRGAGIEVVDVPVLPYAEVAGQRVAVTHLNLYICNGAVIVPVTGAPQDADGEAQALEIIASEFPGREVIAVPGEVLAYGGGGPHCITQQVPVARETDGPPGAAEHASSAEPASGSPTRPTGGSPRAGSSATMHHIEDRELP